MALSLKYGRDKREEVERIEVAYTKALECRRRFEKEFGSILCYDLIGYDLSTPEGRKGFKESNLREKKCTKFVERAIKILLELIKE